MKKLRLISLLLLLCGVFCVYAKGKKDSDKVPSDVTNSQEQNSGEVASDSSDEQGADSGLEDKTILETPAPKIVHSAVLNGPTGIPSAYFFENKPDLDGAELELQVFVGADIELPKLLKGEVDIGVLPVNVATKVFNSTNGAITALAVVGNGNVYVISTDENLKSLEDLKGKTVAVAGQGATPDYIFQYILQSKGISIGSDENSVALDYSTPNSELAAAVLGGKFKYAVVPEPFATVATVKSKAVIRAVNLSDEYALLTGGQNYPLSLLVANSAFAAENKNIVNKYIDSYKVAVEKTLENPNKAGVMVQKHTLGLMAPIAAKAIPNCAFTCVDAIDCRESIEKLIDVYLSFAPSAVGGKKPSDSFYYSR